MLSQTPKVLILSGISIICGAVPAIALAQHQPQYPAPVARPTVIPHGGYRINPPYTTSGRQGLTPASAFYGPPRPVHAAPAPAGPPGMAHAVAPMPRPVEQPRRQAAPQQLQQPVPPPVQHARMAPAPAPEAIEAPAPTPARQAEAAPAHDPMAPRPDALIFRVGPNRAPAPLPATEGAAPSQGPAAAAAAAPPPGYAPARYYSVHRQYGRQPDPAPATTPVYLDALPVDVTGMAGSSDLAEPPAPPTLIRNNNGRIQALPDLNDTGPE